MKFKTALELFAKLNFEEVVDSIKVVASHDIYIANEGDTVFSVLDIFTEGFLCSFSSHEIDKEFYNRINSYHKYLPKYKIELLNEIYEHLKATYEIYGGDLDLTEDDGLVDSLPKVVLRNHDDLIYLDNKVISDIIVNKIEETKVHIEDYNLWEGNTILILSEGDDFLDLPEVNLPKERGGIYNYQLIGGVNTSVWEYVEKIDDKVYELLIILSDDCAVLIYVPDEKWLDPTLKSKLDDFIKYGSM